MITYTNFYLLNLGKILSGGLGGSSRTIISFINCTLCKKKWKLKDPKKICRETDRTFTSSSDIDRHKTSQVGFDCHGILTNTSFK